jgi:hypothetical protein
MTKLEDVILVQLLNIMLLLMGMRILEISPRSQIPYSLLTSGPKKPKRVYYRGIKFSAVDVGLARYGYKVCRVGKENKWARSMDHRIPLFPCVHLGHKHPLH